jgi:hypothetical protein
MKEQGSRGPAVSVALRMARRQNGESRRRSSLHGKGSFADRHVVASPKAATERLNQLFPMSQESRQYRPGDRRSSERVSPSPPMSPTRAEAGSPAVRDGHDVDPDARVAL